MIKAAIASTCLMIAPALGEEAPAIFDETGVLIDKADGVLPDADVTDQFGNKMRFRDAVGDGTFVLNFTYTRCTELCGMADLYLTDIDERRRELNKPVQLVTLTLDPARDRPEDLLQRHQDFGSPDGWLRLTGDPADILPLLIRLGAWDGGPLEDHKLFVIVGDVSKSEMVRLEADPWLPDRIYQLAADYTN
ncbi:SCO family protein [Paracoccus sp. SCSIO 75233]|uniref:SCO family protein n=1 Tax=Paracoccus sp. SCSIO 75233 TaxID=3017782 RepID=UPI0022F07BC6|nr:SCO family protein [Paracoccus sp. SCSIO 75233]WBU51909.1 SCO family protein [Paracoccus sp. SCSIO 75233]